METNTATVQIALTSSDEELEEGLKGIITSSMQSVEAEIATLRVLLAKGNVKLARAKEKERNRERIHENIEARLNKRRREHDKARIAFDRDREKLWHKRSKTSSLQQTTQNLSAQITQKSSFTRTVSQTFAENSFETRASMLRAAVSHLDPEVPISYNSRLDGAELIFKTADIYLKDGMGGWDDTNFGKFHISINYRISDNGISRVTVRCNSDRYRRLRSPDYVHPHIRSDGEACLGNVQAMLMEHMKNKDVAMAVNTFIDYITTYNHLDPYRTANTWGVITSHSRPMHKIRCDCGVGESHLRHLCPSVTNPGLDAHTGEVLTEVNTAPCGCSFSSCLAHHVYVPGSKGFNNSGCQPKELASMIPAIRGFSDRLFTAPSERTEET